MRTVSVALGVALAVSLAVVPAASASHDDHCARVGRLHVPTAERQQAACLDDLTTAGTTGTPYTDPADWAGLHPPGAMNPPGVVPGIQIDGYFPDTSTTNTNHGWHHDSQFVIRLPDHWNGGLVVAGSPGVREQYANDFVISDWVVASGYAFAATDKGNTGVRFFEDGARPGDAIAEWNARVTQLTIAAKATLAQRYGRPPRTTIAAGLSNGGYLVRWQLENRPWLFDAGLDWEGVLWRTDGPNLLTFLPPTLRGYQRLLAGDPAGRDQVIAAGFPAESQFLWPFHYQVYWDLTQRIYREELDPDYDGALAAGNPFCASGTPNCDADYDYASRPDAVRAAVSKIALTGRIGRPMITLHGTLDALLPISQDSDVYRGLIEQSGRGAAHRYYRIVDGNHVDGLYGSFPDKLRPILPCFHAALAAMEAWLTGTTPPPSATLPRPTSGDLANTCSLTG